MHKKLIVNCLLVFVCAFALTGCHGGTPQQAPAQYKTMKVSVSDVTVTSRYPATVKGLQDVDIYPQITGLLTDICISEGEPVRKGQVLFVIDQATYLAEHATAAADVAIAEAALSAARVRLRPILMTALTLVVGMLPLVFASGAGANGNISLGIGVVGGMIVGTTALLFIVPVLFIIFRTVEEKVMRRHNVPLEDNDRIVEP
ncbi:MAG: efflux RND transporter permease subunit [Candidatus Cryptobacteroides sp.]